MNLAMAALASHSADNGDDTWRPRYHFQPQSGWMNDVNGPFYLDGYYHVFYQHNPFYGRFGKIIGWGHARSRNLVDWEQLPFAVWPSSEHGEVACWSGGMAMDGAGKPVLLYTAVLDWPATKPFVQSGAVPVDKELIQWKKHPANPLLPHHALGEPLFDPMWRDPFGFKAGGRTFVVVGATKVGMPIYEAKDDALGKWAYRGFVFPEDAECPNFFQLGDHFVFLSSAFSEGVKYSVGKLELKTLKYEPKTRGVMDEYRNFAGIYGTGVLFDDKGRCIFLARMQGGRNGFNGYLALPRVLTVGDDGYLRQQPVPELEKLRGDHEQHRDATIEADKPLVLKTKGECLEIVANLEPRGATAFGLELRRSDDGKNFVSIRYADGKLDVAGTQFPLPLQKDQPLALRIFLDRIALEVFVSDGRHVVSKSITPPETDLGVAVFAEGGPLALGHLDAWTMNPAPIKRNDDPPAAMK
jgi:beta-fructofuranosidase